jgi:hypothetical protein
VQGADDADPPVGTYTAARDVDIEDTDAATTPASAPADGEVAATAQDGPVLLISQFEIGFVNDHPDNPTPAELLDTIAVFSRTATGLVSPRIDGPTVTLNLAHLPEGAPTPFHLSALQTAIIAVRDRLLAIGYMGIFVAPAPGQVNTTGGTDARAPGDTSFKLLVTIGVVSELHTTASGERIASEERRNHPDHGRLKTGSPLRPAGVGGSTQDSLMRRDVLENYAFLKSRHPGRQLDASVAAGQNPGGVALDLMVSETKPLSLWAQLSNTGTSYERPFFDSDRVRWRVEASVSDYTADELGFRSDAFKGTSGAAGAEMIWNVHQNRDLFIDIRAGARFQHLRVKNRIVDTDQAATFAVTWLGGTLERHTDWTSLNLGVSFEGAITGTPSTDLALLGRPDVDDKWITMQWNADWAMYLEPMLDRDAWLDPTSPASSTLAHELFFSFRGQWAFENRLVPQFEQIAGGFYTVRGYRQAVAVGDSVLLGTAEYRFHVPRIFSPVDRPGELLGRTFRWSPQHVYGSPDWDLILRGFVDAGRTINSHPLPFEDNHTLIGAGIGAELRIRRNVNIRVDWGFALRDLDELGVSAGSSQVHIVATILF